MTVFVFCMNLLVAAFVLAFLAEISLLLIGSLVFAYRVLRNMCHK